VVGLGQQPGRESTAGGQVVGGVLPQGFVDVDGLKRVNDARGHAAGDRLLTCVAYALVSALRTADIVTRYGGDEFLCVLPGADHATVSTRLAHLNTELGSTSDPCAVTIGVAQLRPGETSSDLVARADTDLYRHRR